MSCWLADFVKYASYGEASPKLMYWVGVSTIAGALRRKVWFDQKDYQWSPNFYLLIVGEPGFVRKSTSIDVGMRLLRQVEGVNFGPNEATYQALLTHMGELQEYWRFANGQQMEMSCVTLAISEFGSFFDPEDRKLIDNLTDLWDNKQTHDKRTKTSGNDHLVNPWINIVAATTPKWLAQNFSDSLVGGGLAGRFIIFNGEMPTKDIAYPARAMPPGRALLERELVSRLKRIAEYEGPVELTEAAYEWGEEWYARERALLRSAGAGSLEAGFAVRKQCHLHKLAIVLTASRQKFPVIDVPELVEADRQLTKLGGDMQRVFAVVGQTKVTNAAREIAEAVAAAGGQIERRKLFRERFFRTMQSSEFAEAVASAVQAELVVEVGDLAKPLLILKRH